MLAMGFLNLEHTLKGIAMWHVAVTANDAEYAENELDKTIQLFTGATLRLIAGANCGYLRFPRKDRTVNYPTICEKPLAVQGSSTGLARPLHAPASGASDTPPWLQSIVGHSPLQGSFMVPTTRHVLALL